MYCASNGWVVSAEERVVVEEGRRRTETTVVVRYPVGQRELELSRVLHGARGKKMAPGTPVRVNYNPAEPEMAELIEP